MPIFRGKRVTRPNPMGKHLGEAMSDALKPLAYAYRADEGVPTEDESGLIPSDKFVKALGDSLEAKGYKRL